MNTKSLRTFAFVMTAGITLSFVPSVWADDRSGAGIGGGSGGNASDIVINGGTVTAHGGGVGEVTEEIVRNIAKDEATSAAQPKADKTETQAALDAKADKTTTVNGHALSDNVTVTKSDVGLGNVDNTSDANKPVSTATQTALNAKQNTVPALGGTAKPVYVSAAGTFAACSATVGSTTEPTYLNAGTITAGSTYAGGTAVTLNGTSKAASAASFYAPTTAGTSGYVLKSAGTGSAPTWGTSALVIDELYYNATGLGITDDTTPSIVFANSHKYTEYKCLVVLSGVKGIRTYTPVLKPGLHTSYTNTVAASISNSTASMSLISFYFPTTKKMSLRTGNLLVYGVWGIR